MTRIRFTLAQVKTFPADAATGEVLGLEALVERDSDGFMEWLGDFASGCGVEAVAADDLSAYKPAV